MDGSSRQVKKTLLAKKRPARLSVLEFTRIISLLTFRARPSSLSLSSPSVWACSFLRSVSLSLCTGASLLSLHARLSDLTTMRGLSHTAELYGEQISNWPLQKVTPSLARDDDALQCCSRPLLVVRSILSSGLYCRQRSHEGAGPLRLEEW